MDEARARGDGGKPRVLVLRTAGTNCDAETAHAFRLAGAAVESLHVGALLSGERRLEEFSVLAVPGGFSYGDDLGAGTVLANELGTRLADALASFVASKRLVIGICNGFQVLVRLGLLPGWEGEKAVSLVENTSGRFEARWVRLAVETDRSPFLAPPAGAAAGAVAGGRRTIRLPVAHKEGRFVVRAEETLSRLRDGGHIALTYVDPEGREEGPASRFPWNPNGSVAGIAGLINEAGNVLGLMPHPERNVRLAQDPSWTRLPSRARSGEPGRTAFPADEERAGDGYSFFAGAVRYASRLG